MSVHYVTLDDGLTLRVIQSGPAADDAPAVVLVHGWSASVYTFAEMIPALAEAGYRVIAFDLPGHGLSDKPGEESKYTTRALSDTVLSVASAMSVRRFAFVGHSLGGSLGLDLATRGESRLQRMVLINSVGLGSAPLVLPIRLFSPSIVNRIVPVLLTRRMVELVLRIAFGTSERPTERDIDEYWAPTQFDEFVSACRACLHRVAWGRIPANKLRSVSVPVLVITGGRDLLVRGAVDRAMLVPNVRIVTIREGGHLVLQECASQTNEELLRFLKPEP
ncbi:MAG TPA: alpha/beta hydrolase [Gemmatimonadaceae bacterium]